MSGEVRSDREREELELRTMLSSGFMPTSEGPKPITEDVAKAMIANLDEGISFSNGSVDGVEYPDPAPEP